MNNKTRKRSKTIKENARGIPFDINHIENMTDEEFDDYLIQIRWRKKYVNRYYIEKHYETGIDFEQWMKIEIRQEKLNTLGI